MAWWDRFEEVTRLLAIRKRLALYHPDIDRGAHL